MMSFIGYRLLCGGCSGCCLQGEVPEPAPDTDRQPRLRFLHMSRRDLANLSTALWNLTGGQADVAVDVDEIDEAIGAAAATCARR